MNTRRFRPGALAPILLGAVLLATTPLTAQKLGTVTFPTSGSAAAQPFFVEGVKDLYSFEFDEAAVAFQKAESLDPGFAMAYWGEAMSHNHPLWAEVDVPAARQALEKLAPTEQERVAKAKTEKEKTYLAAVDRLFYAPGDKLARDSAYSQAMGEMYKRWPEDDNVSLFYALSVLGTVRPGDTGFRRQALAASIALRIFQENPDHPGAAHFIIHAFDDPDHAILALPAARAYAKIAPASAHATHMPSHIFVQLGMWQDLENSNIAAYKLAEDQIARLHTPEGREDFHTLLWLEYARLMLGKFDEAKQNVELARQAAERNPNNVAVQQGYLGIRARYILESGRWENIPLEPVPAAEPHAAGSMVTERRYTGTASWIFIAGLSSARMGQPDKAEKAAAELDTMRQQVESGGNKYAAKPLAIMAKELSAAAQLARGEKEEAVRLAKEASDIESEMGAPSGPPEPMKPAPEFYGEVLLAAGRSSDAAAAFNQQLLRTPNRTPSVRGLAQAEGGSKSSSAAAF